MNIQCYYPDGRRSKESEGILQASLDSYIDTGVTDFIGTSSVDLFIDHIEKLHWINMENMVIRTIRKDKNILIVEMYEGNTIV